jgi:hypothetical protein
MKIGDVSPMPDGWSPEAVAVVMRRRGLSRILQTTESSHRMIIAAKAAMKPAEDARWRMHNRAEQAKHFLRLKGFIPVATLDGVHMVGRHRLSTDAELFNFAYVRGWKL